MELVLLEQAKKDRDYWKQTGDEGVFYGGLEEGGQ